MANVGIDKVWRSFGPYHAVADLNLEISDGEFVVLLGPSGCGKTTSLRMLAGLERPTSGIIRIDNQVVNDVPPGDRDIGMVFQSYALYPHMTVYRNLVFGPRVRRENKAETQKNVQDVAEVLGLQKLLDRRPNELSGGQRQRVALGRALLRRPRLFLMDEPLSNLDAALRGQVRAELVRLHRKFGITTVYVTHDQVEAMTMADKIAVMFQGRLQQVGSAQEVFDNPVNRTVATFIGSPQMNILPGRLSSVAGRTAITLLGHEVTLPPWARLSAKPQTHDILVGVRPTDISAQPPDVSMGPRARIEFVKSLGPEIFLTLSCASQTLVCRAAGRQHLTIGDEVSLGLDPDYLYAFDQDTGKSLIDRSLYQPGQNISRSRGP